MRETAGSWQPPAQRAPRLSGRTSAEHSVLPELGVDGLTGRTVVDRAVRLVLTVVALLVVIAIVAASVVRVRTVVRGVGVLVPGTLLAVRAGEEGTLDRVYVRSGQRVRAGERLAVLDSVPLAEERTRLELTLAGRRSDLERAVQEAATARTEGPLRVAAASARIVGAAAAFRERAALFRQDRLVDSVATSYVPGGHVELDRAFAELRAAEVDREAKRLSLGDTLSKDVEVARHLRAIHTIRDQLALLDMRRRRLVLTAPIDGVVLSEHPERLDGSAVRRGDMVLEIGQVETWQVRLTVAEQDVQQVSVGDSALVVLGALRRLDVDRLEGVVRGVAVARLASEPSGVGTTRPGYEVVVELTDRAVQRVGVRNLRVGLVADTKIVTRTSSGLQAIRDHLLRTAEGTRE